MSDHHPAEGNTEESPAQPDATQGLDPRDTDHPTGTDQAAENAANDPPG